METKVLKSYQNPTTLVVIGSSRNNYYTETNSDVKIDDDETGFDIIVGNEKLKNGCDSDGFITIMTLPEFKLWQIKNEERIKDYTEFDSFLLPNFKGTIGVTALDMDNNFTIDFNIDDYITHQINCSVYLTFPEGTEIVNMKNYQIPVEYDIKMIDLSYNPIITERVLKTKEEQYTNFTYQGHPNFYIPDFHSEPCDIHQSFLDYIEKLNSLEICDQDGGECSYEILDNNTGLTKCTYNAYGVLFSEYDDDAKDFTIEIEGYIVESLPMTQFNEDDEVTVYIFVATKVQSI